MKEVINIPASVSARLQTIARVRNLPFQKILQYYGFERFLYRLSASEYADRFVLKGGLIFYALGFEGGRLTKDIDFRGFTGNSFENLSSVMRTIFMVPVISDGLDFDEQSLKFEEISEDADYTGIRISFEARLGNIRIPIKVDIGFSDIISPETEEVIYPVLLKEMDSPRVRIYPLETVISEKFHAMVMLADINSRWRDYYDIWKISETYNFSGEKIRNAIQSTFSQRRTGVPTLTPIALTDDFGINRQSNWRAFLQKEKLYNENIESFIVILHRLSSFLLPPVEAINAQKEFSKEWIAKTGWK